MTCFRFTCFKFTAKCPVCGARGEMHDVDFKFFCGECCPACRVAKPFEDEPLPASVAGEQADLFGGKDDGV